MIRGVVAAAGILARLPWEACREGWTAAGNLWLWAVLEWDASRRRGRRRGGW